MEHGALVAAMRSALDDADDRVRAAWERIAVDPVKWQCSPYGDEDGGFWVVAVLPDSVIWYNHIEEGFNQSPYSIKGVIGRYDCNQNDFAEFLSGLPEAVDREAFAATAPTIEAPAELRGPGRIVRRQTTYWIVQSQAGELARISFTNKLEMSFVTRSFESLQISQKHPLLEHREASVNVFVTDVADRAEAMARALDARIRTATQGWRSAST